ncbi:unnamed protein product [Adineta steineri]|uniref:Uncharacterized protein n=1 Tax=Adineta steineri TaxID=433720 RepID=A0A814YID6_9BILA|nr:unnamed protein product [Adineta steineri]
MESIELIVKYSGRVGRRHDMDWDCVCSGLKLTNGRLKSGGGEETNFDKHKYIINIIWDHIGKVDFRKGSNNNISLMLPDTL